MLKKTFKITDMHCSNCAMRIESIEDDLLGVKEISASYQKGWMIIEFDEAQLAETDIIAAVKKKGYTTVG